MKYTIKQAPSKSFNNKNDFIQFLKKNKEDLYRLKKMEYKESTPIVPINMITTSFQPKVNVTTDKIRIKAIINSTNVIDSHMDLHLPSIWNKTVSDNPYSFHLKEHKRSFEDVISNKAKSYNEIMTFKDIGIDSEMSFVANINDFVLEEKDFPYMFKMYAEGKVTAHSVGMKYVKISLAYYDEDDEKELNYFNESKAKAINPEVADENGYLWVIQEAQKIEGSAVVFASNSITPTLIVEDYKNIEPSKNTQEEPQLALTEINQIFNF